MAASAGGGAPVRQPRRGPAPIASFDHDVSDEVRPPSSPESKQAFRLPEIREDPATSLRAAGDSLAPPEQRARSHSTPAAGLHTPAAPRIDISRASSSSHHDSRDSSPELALFAGTGGNEDARGRLELGFREDGALDLRSSTEELAFLEGGPGGAGGPGEPRAGAAPPPPAGSRRHSRKDSQGSEAALLAVSGRTSRLSSVGSQCSAHSALSGFSHASRVSRLSVVSGVSRSPSPHRMLLETSFCGPKPIETDPEICAAAVEERLLEIAKMNSPAPVDARDHREVRTEVTVESTGARQPPATPPASPAPAPTTPAPAPAPASTSPPAPTPAQPSPDEEKRQKETRNRARIEDRRARPKVRREPSEPEVYKSENRSRDIIRIRLKPEKDYEDNDEESELTAINAISSGASSARKPDSLALERAARPASTPAGPAGLTAPAGLPAPAPGDPPPPSPARRSPSPSGPVVSRKSSFCSLFKSRETIASPDSPSDALRRKRSLTEGRSRSKSRDRSATPTSANKIRGSVLSLFRTPKRGATSPSPSSREGSPVVQQQRLVTPAPAQPPPDRARRGERLKYYEDAKDGIIHIPLRTPPDERPGSSGTRREVEVEVTVVDHSQPREVVPRPASAPQPRIVPETASTSSTTTRTTSKPIRRTVLPDGSIIIPLRSPTEKTVASEFTSPTTAIVEPAPAAERPESSEVGAPSPMSRVSTDSVMVSLNGEADNCNGESVVAKADTPQESTPAPDDGRRKRKERLVFTTHVGSREQVFSTQFSITKTPSVTSEISGSFPSFVDGDDTRPAALRDTHITGEGVEEKAGPGASAGAGGAEPADEAGAPSPQEAAARDSSESEPSSEAAPARSGNDVERRGLVVQESFEEELPYVPTTLPLERSVALPMVPVRDRGGVRVTGVERPRAAGGGAVRAPVPPPARALATPAAPHAPHADKLRIRLPRRARTASLASPAPTLPDRISRPRTRSGGDGIEARPKPEWIDFEEVPERRKQPKRIQTLPAGAEGAGSPGVAGAGGAEAAGGVVFSYVEPEQCRCECHAHARPDDQLPLLQDDHHRTVSTSSLECADEEGHVRLNVQIAHPFTADLDLHPEEPVDRVMRNLPSSFRHDC